MHFRAARPHRIPAGFALRPIESSDLRSAHGLSIGVGWPHRPEDWRFAFQIGEGFVACDKADRVLGSAMWWPFGSQFAAVGMVIVSPRLQARGAGRNLMDAIFSASNGRNLRVNATKAAYRLYETSGFRPIGQVFQHQGIARFGKTDIDSGSVVVRHMIEADWAKIPALDRAAFGADRTTALGALKVSSTGVICERAGEPVGFSLCRKFGRGHLIGPIVAEDETMAIALSVPHICAHEGEFLRFDTSCEDGGFARFLQEARLVPVDNVTTMVRGQEPRSSGTLQVFGAINQALG